jgi:hypothetical protein
VFNAVCGTSDLIQTLKSSCDTINLVDDNNNDVYVSFSCDDI